MKDTLKTFPCGQTPLCNTNDKGERIYCHQCKKPEEWKQRIVKELREKLKFQSKYHVVDTYGMRIMKEILGDKVKQNEAVTG